MPRMIDADALMVWLVNMLNEFDDGNDPHEIKREMFQVVLAKTRKMPTVVGWVSVKDRLPEDEYECLVCSGGSIEFGWFHCGTLKWVVDGSMCGDGYVPHWMSLPEPPEEDNDDNSNH